MLSKRIIGIMVVSIALLASFASLTGIFSNSGPGEYTYNSIHGQIINIYGKGIYQHMSSDVAIQGIAQDYVTFFLGVPLLIISFIYFSKGSLRWKYILAGTVGYFMVTYFFYMCMGMYNALFLVYVLLASLSFYTFIIMVLSFDLKNSGSNFNTKLPGKIIGGFLIFCSIAIALMWLGVVIPPLIDGRIYPKELNHYTTLIVQGLDLSILLPASFISGLLLIRKNPLGYILAPVYNIFLSILMTALTAKVIGMSLAGVNAGPAIIIIPIFNSIAIITSSLALKNINNLNQPVRFSPQQAV